MTARMYENTYLYIDKRMARPEIHAIARGEAAVFSDASPGRADSNEDAAAVIATGPQSAVLFVADGLGGTVFGKEASRLATITLTYAVNKAVAENTEMQSAILAGIEKANHEILALGCGAATTIAVAEVHGDTVRTYHVGDSSVFVFGQKGKIKLQTISHSPVGFALEAGILNEQEAIHHEDLHIVSNVIGARDMRIEIGMSLKLAARDTLLLASDGLTDNLLVEEMIGDLRKGSLLKAADKLMTDSKNRMCHAGKNEPSKPDDITFIAYRGFKNDKQKPGYDARSIEVAPGQHVLSERPILRKVRIKC